MRRAHRLGSEVVREGEQGRTGAGDPGRGPVGPAFWVMSTHTTEGKEVIYCYVFNNSKRLKIISIFHW